MEAILREVENNIFANSTLYLSPRFFGYINTGGNQAAILGELLASAVNQLCAKWHFSPAASEVERRVIQWITTFIGYPAGGCLLSGGSTGNLVGLAVDYLDHVDIDFLCDLAHLADLRGWKLVDLLRVATTHRPVVPQTAVQIP
jgi:hypothetical protein